MGTLLCLMAQLALSERDPRDARVEGESAATDARCMDCHAPEKAAWRGSVHARNQTGCVSCHGADEVNPGAAKKHLRKGTFKAGTKNTNVALCSGCHGKEAGQFKESPHWEDPPDPDAKKLRGCVQCHEHHGTTPAARASILAERCSKCHKEASEARKQGEKYVALAGGLANELEGLRAFLTHPLPGVPYAKAQDAGDAGEAKLREARLRQHSCEFKALEKLIPPAVPPVADARKMMEEATDQASSSRRTVLIAFLALMAINLVLARAWCRRTYGSH